MKVTVVTPKQAKADAYVVGVLSKDKKRTAPGLSLFGQKTHGLAKRLLENKNAGLGLKQVLSVPAEGRDGVLVLVGLGEAGDLTQEKLGTAMHAALKHVKGLGLRHAATSLITDATSDDGLDERSCIQALVHGAVIGDLQFDQYKSKEEEKEPDGAIVALQLVHERAASWRTAASKAKTVAEAVNDARLLANAPGNIATPKWMANEARKRGRKHGFKVTVKGRATLQREGYGAILAVGQGSANEEQLVVMDYHPEGAKKTLVVVGKGVCFDSGGISIKPGQGMWDMKYDKCGACNVVALMATLKDLGVKHRVIGITPLVENMPSSTAQRPGDIITAKDGTTIEVLNTDAEGRLILADAITHARTFDPEWIVEQSTLTGACLFAVGETFVAVMSKDDALADSLLEASRTAGDKAWRLPQGEEFDEANRGTYGDIQNISLTNKAGTSIGGSFVGHFAKDTRFAHLDIASKAWTSGTDYFAKGPTGAGLRIALQRILDEP